MAEMFDVPKRWMLSPQQEVVIGSMMDTPGRYVSAFDLCPALYDEECEGAAPPKLRVLLQRCRDIVDELTYGEATIENKRGRGWRLTKASCEALRKVA